MMVRLSLMAMTNLNRVREVLVLLVCSKMTDETNLRSELLVAVTTRKA